MIQTLYSRKSVCLGSVDFYTVISLGGFLLHIMESKGEKITKYHGYICSAVLPQLITADLTAVLLGFQTTEAALKDGDEIA